MIAQREARIFLVDDHDVVRAGTRQYLAGCTIVGESDNAIDAIEMIREREPDLVLLDIRLPGGGGAAVVEAVRQTHPGMRFLVYTSSTSRRDVVRLLALDVNGYITKSDHDGHLADRVCEALDGGRPISREVAAHLLDIDDSVRTASGIEELTPREREVTNLIARGYTYAETASRLEISPKTVEKHMHNLLGKLGIATRNELTRLMYEEGFFRPEDDPEDES